MNLFSNNMIEDIANEIKQYNSTNTGKTPSYIIVNEVDSKLLLSAMVKAKLIPDNTPTKRLTLFGLRVIRTTDIPEGYFDIVSA